MGELWCWFVFCMQCWVPSIVVPSCRPPSSIACQLLGPGGRGQATITIIQGNNNIAVHVNIAVRLVKVKHLIIVEDAHICCCNTVQHGGECILSCSGQNAGEPSYLHQPQWCSPTLLTVSLTLPDWWHFTFCMMLTTTQDDVGNVYQCAAAPDCCTPCMHVDVGQSFA